MAYTNIDALYANSFRIKIQYFFPNNFKFYKWSITKVAHCTIAENWEAGKVFIFQYFISYGQMKFHTQLHPTSLVKLSRSTHDVSRTGYLGF